jgi:catalase
MSTVLRTSNGAPVPDNQNSISVGPFGGPLLIQDFNLIDKLAHFDRERIPERVVHAKGAGAKGYFEVTNDLTNYTKCAFLNQVGKRTPVITRFSTVGGEKGSSDVARDPRGFAVKFYTEEGNWDMVGNNTPVFFIRDPTKFPDFIHTQKRCPRSNCGSPNAVWDFQGLSPETTHQFMYLFGDRGIPDGYRHMNGYSSHTWKWVNGEGKATWVKFHFKTESGIKNLSVEDAAKIQSSDLDYATKDLHDHLQNGGIAAWRVYVQLMPFEEAFNYRFNAFDITKIWPHSDYPLVELGRMVLDSNPENYFAEIEQAAFSPSHLVPGIEPSPDKMLQGRLFSYPDTHRHRLGPNYQQIPVNCPYRTRGGVTNYHRDGLMNTSSNGGSGPNYEPNSFNGPREDPTYKEHTIDVRAQVGRHRYNHPNCDFQQPKWLYEKVFDAPQRQRLTNNLINSMKGVSSDREDIKIRAVRNFYRVSPELGTNLARGLNIELSKIKATL